VSICQENYITEAEALIQKDKLKDAVKKLERGIKKDRKNAEAYYLLGETYRRLGTLSDRLNSSRALERALKFEPENTQYLYSFGLLKVRQGFKAHAEHTFKKIIEIDSTFSEAYHQLGLMHYRKALRYRGMISAGGLIDMTEFGLEEQEKSKGYIEQALTYDETNDEIFYHLGLLYLDDKDWDKMVELFRRALVLNPESKEAHLFIGYAHQRKSNFEEAEREYVQAKSLMSMEEAAALESIEILLNNKEKDNPVLTGSQTSDAYWTQKNPSYLSDYNERKIEHYSRFAYVNLRFGNPETGLNG